MKTANAPMLIIESNKEKVKKLIRKYLPYLIPYCTGNQGSISCVEFVYHALLFNLTCLCCLYALKAVD